MAPVIAGQRHRKTSAVIRWLTMLGGSWLLLLLLTMLFENFLIYPAPRYPAGDWQAAHYGAEDVYLTSADGTQLHGWFFPHPQARGHLLFCHGNAEHVGYLGPEMAELRDDHRLNVFAFDYRGYGRSAGSPHEAGIVADGQAAQRWLAQRTGAQVDEIFLFGRSIGGGLAVELATTLGARGLILWNTFSSLPEVAAQHFPWLPVRSLMRNRYDSAAKIPRYSGPLLMVHGMSDSIIGFELGEKLFAAATTRDKTFVQVPNGDHNDPPSPEFLEAFAAFIDRVCHTSE